MRRWFFVLLFPFLAALADGQRAEVFKCGEADGFNTYGLDDIAEPIGQSIKTFANGEVDLILLQAPGHAGPKFAIAVLHPPRDENGFHRLCHIVSTFFYIEFDDLSATYDPNLGLQFLMNVHVTHDAIEMLSKPMTMTVNQATGEVMVMLGETNRVVDWHW